MAGDRARVTYDPARKWRGVVAQQGRVTVEADWNEAATIDGERDRQTTLDVVGPVGTPDGGYAVTVIPPNGSVGDLQIGPGTLYLGGERLDLDPAGVTYSRQPDWLDSSTDPLFVSPAGLDNGFELVYLLASEQEVCAVEDPAIADVALGGPDTMQRQRILQRFVRTHTMSGTCGEASQTALANSLGQGVQLDPVSMMVQSATTLQVSFTTAGGTSTCQPVATGGYLGAENQMIRVMVTSVDATTGVPTIVWGFDDASFLYRVQTALFDPGSGHTQLTLASAPVDSFHFPAAGQAVELLRDAVALTATDYIASATGFVSTLSAAYDPVTMNLLISGQPAPQQQPPADYFSAGATPQLYLRVWQGTVTATPGQPIPLGDTGVAVTLTTSSDTFHAGDFWRFALRPIQPGIVYPARYLEAPQPPDGPRTWACPLATLTWSSGAATVASCVPAFSSLVELTAEGSGGCCTVDVGPQDVGDGASLQALIDSLANQGPVTVCLKPGAYTLPVPLVLGPQHNGITLQACQEGVTFQGPAQPGPEFTLGLISIQGCSPATIRGITLSPPLTPFSPAAASFAGLPQQNAAILEVFSQVLQVAIGISADSQGLTVADCGFNFLAPSGTNGASGFAAGIFATGSMAGLEITGCTFQSVTPPTAVPFYELSANGDLTDDTFPVTLGYFQPPHSTAGEPASTILHDAVIERCLFEGLTVPVLAMGALGTVRVAENTARDCYGGFWFVSADDPAITVMFDLLAVGDQVGVYPAAAFIGAAGLLDRVFVIATAMARVLPTPSGSGVSGAGTIPSPTQQQLTSALQAIMTLNRQVEGLSPGMLGNPLPPLPAGTRTGLPPVIENVFTAAFASIGVSPLPVPTLGPPPATGADTGKSVSLRLDVSGCQVDAVVDAAVFTSTGLLAVDLTADAGSALVHGNRIRSHFPKGGTALITGVGEATVTGNIMANEVVPTQVLFLGSVSVPPPPDNRSIVLGPAATPFSAATTPATPAVAVTGNVFVDATLLPLRPTPTPIPAELAQWDVLNTVLVFATPVPVTT